MLQCLPCSHVAPIWARVCWGCGSKFNQVGGYDTAKGEAKARTIAQRVIRRESPRAERKTKAPSQSTKSTKQKGYGSRQKRKTNRSPKQRPQATNRIPQTHPIPSRPSTTSTRTPCCESGPYSKTWACGTRSFARSRNLQHPMHLFWGKVPGKTSAVSKIDHGPEAGGDESPSLDKTDRSAHPESSGSPKNTGGSKDRILQNNPRAGGESSESGRGCYPNRSSPTGSQIGFRGSQESTSTSDIGNTQTRHSTSTMALSGNQLKSLTTLEQSLPPDPTRTFTQTLAMLAEVLRTVPAAPRTPPATPVKPTPGNPRRTWCSPGSSRDRLGNLDPASFNLATPNSGPINAANLAPAPKWPDLQDLRDAHYRSTRHRGNNRDGTARSRSHGQDSSVHSEKADSDDSDTFTKHPMKD